MKMSKEVQCYLANRKVHEGEKEERLEIRASEGICAAAKHLNCDAFPEPLSSIVGPAPMPYGLPWNI